MKAPLAFIAVVLFLHTSAFAETIAIVNGKIYTMSGGVIEKGTLVIQDGKIQAVGADVQAPTGATTIDAAGKVVLPGFIDAHCRVGLNEISQVAATVDDSESTDPITAQVRASDGFFPESFAIGVTRSNGVTAGVIAPGDVNVIAGAGSWIEFSGKRLDQVVLKDVVAMFATLGEAPKTTYGPRNKMPSTRMGSAALLRETLQKAKEYAEKWKTFESKRGQKDAKPPERDLKLEALQDPLNGKIPFVVSAHRVDDILTAIRIASEFGMKKNLVINHGTDAYKIADLLAKDKIPVLVGPITTQPDRMETLGAIYENAARLHRAGVPIAIQTNETHNARNLPYEAALAVANGLPYEEALKAITIHPARIFGLDSQVGSLETGKRANVIIAAGDPLEPRTEITHVFIAGELMEDANYHKRLWEDLKTPR